jgi:hypothetical protein|tara:strand:- start:60 stop:500 length:441 start_codon:yes stop_codon:yes gene_type:complete
MAHFAQLDDKNNVTQVIVVSNDDIKDPTGKEIESIGIAFCQKLLGADTNWKQTSYNNNLRGNYAGIGMTYMANVATMGVGSTDIFIRKQPYPSWSIGVGTASWYSPISGPPDLTDSEIAAGKNYIWDEDAYNADTNSPKTVGWALT